MNTDIASLADRLEAAEIAKGLSAAQRDAMAFGLRGYFDPNTIRSLRRKGLCDGLLLTPLGLAVRSILRGVPG